jgi:archaellum biogenesis ATPase FlaH
MISQLILNQLCTNEEFTRRTLPFLKDEYFEKGEKLLFAVVSRFINKYNTIPTEAALKLELQKIPNISNEIFDHVIRAYRAEPVDIQWALDETEKFCQDRSIYLAIMESIQIIDGKHKELTNNAIPDILSKALAISFDTNIGHDYIDASDARYDFYHKVESRLPFDLDYFNKITKGGLPNKTLNIILAGTGVGKSLFMCHMAAASLTQGKNVLYITMEMAEERIAERIDANLMNIPIDQLEALPKAVYDSKIQKIAQKNIGKLIIKEYPTGAAHVGHFRALLNELKLKKNFKPDVIFIDYLNICSSSRIRGLGGSVNTYSYVKAIAEEMRGLAVEAGVPLVSATQTTRSGYSNTDVGLEDTSESFGLPATADFMFAVISTEELEKLGQVMVKQLKNRYNDPTSNKRFIIGIDRSRMKLYDVEASAQTLINDAAHVPDKQEDKPLNTFGNREKKNFGGFDFGDGE